MTTAHCAHCAREFASVRSLSAHARMCVPTPRFVLDREPVTTLAAVLASQPARFPARTKNLKAALAAVPANHVRFATYAPKTHTWKRLDAKSSTAILLVTQAWADGTPEAPTPTEPIAAAATPDLRALEAELLQVNIDRAKNDIACKVRITDTDVKIKENVAAVEIESRRAITFKRIERIEKTGDAYVKHVEEETRRSRMINNTPRLLTTMSFCLASDELPMWGTPAQPWYRARDVKSHIATKLTIESAPDFAHGLARVADELALRQDHVIDTSDGGKPITDTFIPISSLRSNFTTIGRSLLSEAEALENDEDDDDKTDLEGPGTRLVPTFEQAERARHAVDGLLAVVGAMSEDARRLAGDRVVASVDFMQEQLDFVKAFFSHVPKAVQRYGREQADAVERVRANAKPKSMPNRTEFWVDRVGLVPTAPCEAGCGAVVDRESYERGYIVARKHGGSNDPCNLRVVCKQCNDAMGTLDADLYRDAQRCAV